MSPKPDEPQLGGPADNEASMDNSAPCPFCGVDAVDPDTKAGDTCAHLVAKWASDPYDDGGGVVAEPTAYSDVLGPAKGLGMACRDLVVFIISGRDEAGIERQLARVRATVAQAGQPTWWRAVESDTLADAGVDNLCDANPEGLGGMAGPIVWSLAYDVPGVRGTTALLGGMTSGYSKFLWSLDRVAAVQALHDAILQATATLHRLLATVTTEPI